VLDSATSPFTGAGYTLWDLGAVVLTDAEGNPPVYQDYGSPPPHFRFADEAGVRLAVAGKKITPKAFSELIRDFVRMHEHVPGAFALTAERFRPSLPPALLDAFVAAGFLECSQDGCRWLDLMAQWVEWASPQHLWESAAESEARHLARYGPIWTTMPSWIRSKVVEDNKLNMLMLPDAIRRFWDGEWKSEQLPDWTDQKRGIDAMEIARQIERLVKSGRLTLDRSSPFFEFFRRFRRDRH
jgi:hypothetical protein